jgi:hypothetical protein
MRLTDGILVCTRSHLFFVFIFYFVLSCNSIFINHFYDVLTGQVQVLVGGSQAGLRDGARQNGIEVLLGADEARPGDRVLGPAQARAVIAPVRLDEPPHTIINK